MDEIIAQRAYGTNWAIQIKRFSDSSVCYMVIHGEFKVRNNVIDFPIWYNDGSIAYDFSERIPKHMKKSVRAMFNRHRHYFNR